MEGEEREPLMISENEAEETSIQTLRIQTPPSRKRLLVKIGLVVGNLISSLVMYASTPIYATIMTDVSDIYNLIVITGFFFPLLLATVWVGQQFLVLREPIYFVCATPWKTLLLCGFLSTVQNIVVILATLPSRTPPYLYPLLMPAIIPITAVARFLIIRKGLTTRQIICCGVVILGIFVSATPTIFSLHQRDEDNGNNSVAVNKINANSSSSSSIGKTEEISLPFLWPMLMLLAQIPVAINYVIYETSAQRRTKELILFYFWTQLFGFLWVLLLFWCDVIPGFGQAASFQDFFLKLNNALECHFGFFDQSLVGCEKIPLVFVLNTISYVSYDVFLIALMAVSDGSVFSTLVSSLSLPLSAIFWMLFKYEEKILSLVWDPIFNYTALFPLAGLALLIPSTSYYEQSSPNE